MGTLKAVLETHVHRERGQAHMLAGCPSLPLVGGPGLGLEMETYPGHTAGALQIKLPYTGRYFSTPKQDYTPFSMSDFLA
jgi:hypothetical protein